MIEFMNGQPKTKDEAVREVAMLTGMCAMSIREIPDCRDERKKSVMIARFRELNEVRVRIIEAWGLQAFAAGLIRK